jgi:hypothetical protein
MKHSTLGFLQIKVPFVEQGMYDGGSVMNDVRVRIVLNSGHHYKELAEGHCGYSQLIPVEGRVAMIFPD